jgi:small subunit ribosomal protein S17
MTRGMRKQKKGVVVSDRMDKTRVVVVEKTTLHPKYKKYMKLRSKLTAHDETNESKKGDWVRLMETRPLSKTKRWRIVEIISKKE